MSLFSVGAMDGDIFRMDADVRFPTTLVVAINQKSAFTITNGGIAAFDFSARISLRAIKLRVTERRPNVDAKPLTPKPRGAPFGTSLPFERSAWTRGANWQL